MALSVVQSAKVAAGFSAVTTLTATLPSTPTPGNLIVVFASLGLTITTMPTGTWTTFLNQTTSNSNGSGFWHVVTAGESSSYTFTFPSGSPAFVVLEISGADPVNPILSASSSNAASPAGSAAIAASTPSLTPTVLGTLAIAAFAFRFSLSTTASQSSGWVSDQLATPGNSGYHAVGVAHRSALTSDTTTAISDTFSGTNGSTSNQVAALIALIAPAATAAASAALFFSL